MSFTINRYSDNNIDPNNNFPLILPINTVDTTTTSIKLIGPGVTNYGEIIAQNLLHILENFAGEFAPSNAITGQLWYDTSSNKLRVYTGVTTQWVDALGLPLLERLPEVENSKKNDLTLVSTLGGTIGLFNFDGVDWKSIYSSSSSSTNLVEEVSDEFSTNQIHYNYSTENFLIYGKNLADLNESKWIDLGPHVYINNIDPQTYTNIQNGKLWVDTTTNPPILKIFDDVSNQWKVISDGIIISNTFPSSPFEGQIFYNNVDNLMYYYNGTSWSKFLSNDEPSQIFVSDTPPLTFSSGTLWYKRNSGTLFIYDNSTTPIWKSVGVSFSATAPSTISPFGYPGQLWLKDDTVRKLYVYTGNSLNQGWEQITSDGNIPNGTSFPSNPNMADLFYNKIVNIYDGTKWTDIKNNNSFLPGLYFDEKNNNSEALTLTTSYSPIISVPSSKSYIINSIKIIEYSGTNSTVNVRINSVVDSVIYNKNILSNDFDEVLEKPLILKAGDILEAQSSNNSSIQVIINYSIIDDTFGYNNVVTNLTTLTQTTLLNPGTLPVTTNDIIIESIIIFNNGSNTNLEISGQFSSSNSYFFLLNKQINSNEKIELLKKPLVLKNGKTLRAQVNNINSINLVISYRTL